MNVIALDTETGGLVAGEHALLSVGGCCSWNGSALDCYITAESQPMDSIEPGAIKVNGYAPEIWKKRGARALRDAFRDVSDWIGERLQECPDAVVVCHNLAHDLPFLRDFARCNGHDDLCPGLHRYAWRCSQQRLLGAIDSGLVPPGSSSLNRLAELSGWPGVRSAQHGALEDARIAMHGFLWLCELCSDSIKQRLTLESLVCEVADYQDGKSDWDEAGRIARIVASAAKAIHEKKKGAAA